jgi:tetratricopeptide (TPR) repeat protein
MSSTRERAGIALRPVGPRAILPCSRHLDNAPEDLPGDMSFWRRLFGSNPSESLRPQRLDYLNEALALERQGDYEAALTSYRLALRDHPTDPKILQNMAIAYTKTGLTEEAIRHYRRALELDPNLVGAHYGVAFLLLKKGDADQAASHLRAFLARPPRGTDAERWIKHAEGTLRQLETDSATGAP